MEKIDLSMVHQRVKCESPLHHADETASPDGRWSWVMKLR